MAVIFIESSIPMGGGPREIAFLTELNPGIQNFLHIPIYGLLVFFWARALKAFGLQKKYILVWAFFITVLYGCLDELHQTFVPGRFGGLLDIYLDCIGSVLGIIGFIFWYDRGGHPDGRARPRS